MISQRLSKEFRLVDETVNPRSRDRVEFPSSISLSSRRSTLGRLTFGAPKVVSYDSHVIDMTLTPFMATVAFRPSNKFEMSVSIIDNTLIT